MTVQTSLADATEKMQKAVGHLKEDLASIRTGRAAPAVLHRVTVINGSHSEGGTGCVGSSSNDWSSHS